MSLDVRRGFCPRSGCGKQPANDHEFCAPCLAYMREETDVDPVVEQQKRQDALRMEN